MKILIVFGTRPEAIKMIPVVQKLKMENGEWKTKQNNNSPLSIINYPFDIKVCVTAQHREMLDGVLNFFDVKPDYDLNIMKKNQDLYDITSNVLLGMKKVLEDFKPDIVLVHGDTTTTFVTSLAAFYKQIKVGHIEAGLRTGDLYAPFPEEANRQITGILANYHFAPTNRAKENLLKEGKKEKNIAVTGNTVIDALFLTLDKIKQDKTLEEKIIDKINSEINNSQFSSEQSDNSAGTRTILNSQFILVTGHRRENFGEGFINICKALKDIALNNPDLDIIYPVHLNPNVQKPVNEILSNIKNIHLIKPLEYPEFVYLMSKCHFIITDSGGVQEEAPSLGKPVLVMRDTTERPEAIEAGTVKLVGTDRKKIVKTAQKLIDNKTEYEKMSKSHNPYGDGKASKRITEFLKEI